MTNTEQKWLKEIRDNTRQLKRIANKLDVIARAIADEDDDYVSFDKPAECIGCIHSECPSDIDPCASCEDFDGYYGEIFGKRHPHEKAR